MEKGDIIYVKFFGEVIAKVKIKDKIANHYGFYVFSELKYKRIRVLVDGTLGIEIRSNNQYIALSNSYFEEISKPFKFLKNTKKID